MKSILSSVFKIAFIFSIYSCVTPLFAQAPQKMSYQAVIRSANNNLITSSIIGIRISVLQGSSTGNTVYSETQTPTTNSNGLVSLEIGTGNVETGSFSAINWGSGTYYIKTETDPTGGTNYSIVGSNQLLSVPYALYAANSAQGSFPQGTNIGDMQYWNGTSWVMIPIGQPGQTLKVTPTNIPQWSQNMLSSVTTISTSDVLAQQATLNGNVTNAGGELVLSRGFCLNTTGNPSVSDIIVMAGAGIGTFNGNAQNLLPSTTYHAKAFSTTIAGTSYGAELVFTTQNGIASVTTTAATDIGLCSANSGGTLLSDGGSPIISYGICYGTNSNPTITNDFVLGDSNVPYIATITTSSANTVYHYRAFVTNGVGTFYGNELTFTSENITTSFTISPATAIKSCVATVNYTVSSSNPSSIYGRGLCYSTTPNPTINDNSLYDNNNQIIINCLTANTTYYVRAFSTNCIETTYSNQISFTTANVSFTITTHLPLAIAACRITNFPLNTINNSAGDLSCISQEGICFSTSPNPTYNDTHATKYDFYNYYIINDLTASTTYYARGYVTSCSGTIIYGNQVTFSTPNKYTSIATTATTNITAGSATLNGTIIGNNVDYLYTGFCYSTNHNPTLADNSIVGGSDSGAFNSSNIIIGLAAGTTYYVRVYANGGGGSCIETFYGNEVSFTTPSSPPYAVGQIYGGGIIFWVNAAGTGGLIAATTDQGAASWGCEGTSISGTSGVQGTGQANTNAIITGCTTAGIAAKICDTLVFNGKSDWYLPSESDLIAIGQLNYFLAGNYWSSTQTSATQAKYVNGIISSSSNKSESSYKVRAIRSF